LEAALGDNVMTETWLLAAVLLGDKHKTKNQKLDPPHFYL
jgi:hypothetical protein